ncbi:MAG: hypothetical protein U0798_06390 [Gemmataceae bacterium]
MIGSALLWLSVVSVTLLGLLTSSPLNACTFCAGGYANRQTFRERAKDATIIVHGKLADPQFGPDGKGTTDLVVTTQLKSDDKLVTPAKVKIPQYLPVVGDTPRDYLLYAGVVEGKIDIVSGVSVPPESVSYVKEAMGLPAGDATKRLAFYFRHLDSKDPTISGDAFLEFAKASDREIAQAAAAFDVAKIRQWLADPKTPAERLGVYAVLLGLCGKSGDEQAIQALLTTSPRPERVSSNLGGLLAGLTLINSKAGWKQIGDLVTNANAPLDERLFALGTIRFFEQTREKETKSEILAIYKSLLAQGDLADMAVEDLRRWGWWNLTAEVLKPFDAKTPPAPILRQAIVRYALTCQDEASQAFLQRVRKSDPALVERVEEGLKRFANPKP